MRVVGNTCIGFLAGLLVVGCTSTTLRIVDNTPPQKSERELPEEYLLDVGIVVLESNIPELYDDLVAQNITPEIRRAEANYIANYAAELLQGTGNWGAVRVLPQATYAVDVLVTGEILHSDGERQILALRVQDSRGEVWLEETYGTLASKYHYDKPSQESVSQREPFRRTYRELSDAMLNYSEKLSLEEIENIRLTTLMRFARDINPDAFEDYVAQKKNGEYEIKRLPSTEDPNMLRVREVREREYLVVDSFADFFSRFAAEMQTPYQNWREASYGEAIAFREERNKSRNRIIAGVAMVVGGAMLQRSDNIWQEYAGYSSVIGGASEVIGGLQNRANMKIHAAALQELGVVAAKEIDPHTIELENSTIRLEGTAQEQYEQARAVLRELYFEYLGLPNEEVEAAQDSNSDIGTSGENITEEFFQDDR